MKVKDLRFGNMFKVPNRGTLSDDTYLFISIEILNPKVIRQSRIDPVFEYLPSYALDCECVLVDVEKPVEQKEKSYEERQRAWLEETGLKVGDTVKVVRTAEDGENGWGNDWVPEMNKYVGKEYTLNRIKGSSGLYVGNWDFPYFVLEKVKKPEYVPFTFEDRAIFRGCAVRHKRDLHAFIISDYTANNVYVGGTAISYSLLVDSYVWDIGHTDAGKPVGKLVST
jgi:hypothetical protein